MSPVIRSDAGASSSPLQALRAPEQRSRGERTTAPGSAATAADAASTPSAVVTIHPAARERARADGASGGTEAGANGQAADSAERSGANSANRPAGATAMAGGNRLPTQVSAALKAYGANQAGVTAEPARPGPSQVAPPTRSTTASNDPTGVTDAGRTKPARDSTEDTAATAEQAQERQLRDQSANLQSAVTSMTRLAHQSARTV